MKSEKQLIGLGFLTAISASLCCITPVLALLAGTSGLASTFSWLDPFRPYFVGITVLVLGFAWYQKLKPQQQIDCQCDTKEETPFIQTKSFLSVVTILAGLMLTFPMYAHKFYPTIEKRTTFIKDQSSVHKAEFTIHGMTCSSCEAHINNEVNKLDGIIKTNVSYEKGNAIIEFDESKTDLEQIEKAINTTGYSVTDKQKLK